MLFHRRRLIKLSILAIAAGILALSGSFSHAQDAPTDSSIFESINRVQISVDTSWVLLTGFLVFFMQAGFAMLESGFVRQTGAVNALTENLFDAGITALIFWAVGFGVAFGADNGSGLFGTDNFFLSGAITFSGGEVIYAGDRLNTLTLFFFQFAFAATASTIATGAMAERTDFLGDIIYSGLSASLVYPIVVHWIWGGGWLFTRGFLDFAGSTVVHTVGGVMALVGAYMLGPRVGRVFGQPPPGHNLGMATLGGMILWFGWYGFNTGSTFGTGDTGLMGLVAVNTTLSAAGGMVVAVLFVYARKSYWDLGFTINGSLAGLVAITAGCAFVSPSSAVLIGLVAGIIVVLACDLVESLKIDDPVNAFAVHGACGIFGTLALGLFAQPELTSGSGGLLMGGGMDLLIIQATGVISVIIFVVIASVIMFGLLRSIGRLRYAGEAEDLTVDAAEHQASIWPDVWDETEHPDADPGRTMVQ